MTKWCLGMLFIAACSSSSAGSSPPADAGRDARDPANCVPPWTPNNEVGVGGYCETDQDCRTEAGAALCSGLYGAPEHDWFCTRLCMTASECGSGETCAQNPNGPQKACAPLVCLAADAGVDAGVD